MIELGLSSVVHNPRLHGSDGQNERRHDELLARGGRSSPSLVDHRYGIPMYESDEIGSSLDEQHD